MRGVRRQGPLELPGPAAGVDPDAITAHLAHYLDFLQVRNYAPGTVHARLLHLRAFAAWCAERGLIHSADVTKPVLERYQRFLFHYRKADGKPLGFTTQLLRLVSVRQLFRHLARHNLVLGNPAADLDLPRREHRLPQDALTVDEAERVLAQADVRKPLGLRDRAILETFYSTGMRRAELAALSVYDLDAGRGTLRVRLGKGKKDRVVPTGERALAWLVKYQDDVRPRLVVEPDPGFLFLNELGLSLGIDWLSIMVKRYVVQAGVKRRGSCHLFRHTAATLMLEGGADVRYVQELLGHSKLESTQVYTQVSIGALKAIHAATHPGARLQRAGAVQVQAPPLHVAARGAGPAEAAGGTSPLAAAVAVDRADLLAELDAESVEEGEA